MEIDNTTENFSVSMPTWLIEVVDIICKQRDYTRSSFITRCVRKNIWAISADDPKLWQKLYDHYRKESS